MERKLASVGMVLVLGVILMFFSTLSSAYVEKVYIDENRYLPSGRINNNFTYNDLDIQASEGGCIFRGTITNTSSVLQAVSITVRAVDASEKPLWHHTISLPAISAGDSYQFEETVDGCTEPVPYRLKFEVSQ